jgi:hypothetical protein
LKCACREILAAFEIVPVTPGKDAAAALAVGNHQD